MRAAIIVAFLLVAVTLTGVRPLPAGRASAESNVTVQVGDFYFCSPSFENGVCNTTVNVGDTVTWTVVAATHTVTQCDATFSTCPTSGGFDSGFLSAPQQFSRTFASAGVFQYRCNVHPTQMRGTITVVAAVQATATPSPAPSAPTATAGSSPTPVPAGQTPLATARAAGIPVTGGPPGSSSAPWLVLVLGALMLGAGGVIAARGLRS